MFGKLFGKKGGDGATPSGPPDLSKLTETGGAFFVPGIDDRVEPIAKRLGTFAAEFSELYRRFPDRRDG